MASYTYDPASGKTPWPFVWTVEPKQYNWSGDINQQINFTVKAIPDPNYPTEWDNYYASQNTTGGVPVATPSLPPQPTLTGYTVSSSSQSTTIDAQYYSVTLADGLVITNLDASLFFPYQSIEYYKDGQKYTATTPQELLNSGYDYIVSFVPSSLASLDKNIILTTQSDSETELSGTFWFHIINNWSNAKSTLQTLVQHSSDYFQQVGSQYGSGVNLDGTSNTNIGNPIDFNPTIPTTTVKKTFVQKYNSTYDQIYKNSNPDQINTIIANENGETSFINELQSETAIDTVSSNVNINDINFNTDLKTGDINFIMSKYNLTKQQVIDLLKGLD